MFQVINGLYENEIYIFPNRDIGYWNGLISKLDYITFRAVLQSFAQELDDNGPMLDDYQTAARQ